MSKLYMRPGVLGNLTSSQYAHVQLWNPENSGVHIHVKEIWVSGAPRGFTIVGHAGSTFGMFSNATFSESRGLRINSVDDPDPDFYSKGHVRTQASSPVDGGQWFNCLQPNVPNYVITTPFVLKPYTGIVVRGQNNGENLNVTYMWEEIVIE
jgi:hypothetical protein